MPQLTPAQLGKLPTTAVVIYRRRFKLVVRRNELIPADAELFSCRVSIGALGHETPKLSSFILSKTLDPPWTMPRASWVPLEQQGITVPGGDPANPIKGAFLQITQDPTGNIGIHGTASFPLGEKASHGCIRVRPENALRLYELVDLGSPVTIL